MARSMSSTGMRPAVGEVAQRRQRRSLALHLVQDSTEHRRHHHRLGDLLVLDGPDPFLWIEPGQAADAATAVQAAQHGGHAGHVVAGHADQLGVVCVGTEELDGGDDVRGQVTMAQHSSLRPRSCRS